MTARRINDEPLPRLDLRLVPPALAVWGGTLAGVSGSYRAMVAVTVGGLLGLMLAVRFRCLIGALAAFAALLAGLAVSSLQWHARAADPLVAAGSAGSWSELTVRIAGPPEAVATPFPTSGSQAPTGSSGTRAPTGSSGTGAADTGTDPAAAASDPTGSAPLRWRIAATAIAARVATRQWRPVVAITIFAAGPGWSGLVPGSEIRASGLLARDSISVLPAVVLRARGSPALLASAPWWQRGAATIRERLAANAAGLDGDAHGLLPGLVVGDTSAIDASLSADAKATGLTHLLAVSGSHFAILCGAVVLVLRRIGPKCAAGGGALVLVGLVVLVGPQASVLRAAVMGSITMMALLLGRSRAALPALGAAVILLLFIDPSLARSAGFALSVQATAGLVLIAPSWSKALQRRGVPSGWADLLAVPAAASVVTMPVIAALSGSISLAGIPANLLAAPAVPAALVVGVLCALAGPGWPTGARTLAHLDEPLLDWIAGVAHRMARWSSAAVPWPASLTGALALAALLAGVLLVLRRRRVRALVVAGCTGAVLIIVPAQIVSVGWPAPGWLITACEVGQGDGMVLSTGEPGSAVVVDAGPDPQLMDGCLERLGITTVPLVILTHLHADHVDGLAGVLPGRSVGAIGVGPDRSSATAWRTITTLAAARGIPVLSMTPGTRWASGGLALQTLGPAAAFQGTDSDPNNDSLVTMATIAGVRILMTGDAETEAQQQLLSARVDLRADILEQPHHGSAKVLPTFVAAVAPQVSLIGVGLDNGYGQPSPKALEQLTLNGVTVLRTDLDGDSAVCLRDGRLSTVTRGAHLTAGAAGVAKPGGLPDGK